MMNLTQTKLVGLTMELDLKTREYNQLCDTLEKLKQSNIDPNDRKLIELKKLFQKNHNDIVEINIQIKKIKEEEEFKEKQSLEKYNPENMFNRKNDISKIEREENNNNSIIQNKENIFTRLINKIKVFFSK